MNFILLILGILKLCHKKCRRIHQKNMFYILQQTCQV